MKGNILLQSAGSLKHKVACFCIESPCTSVIMFLKFHLTSVTKKYKTPPKNQSLPPEGKYKNMSDANSVIIDKLSKMVITKTRNYCKLRENMMNSTVYIRRLCYMHIYLLQDTLKILYKDYTQSIESLS